MMIKVNLSRILGEKRITVKELSLKSDIHYNTLLKIYNEQTKGIEYNILSKLCEALNVNVSELLEYIPEVKAS